MILAGRFWRKEIVLQGSKQISITPTDTSNSTNTKAVVSKLNQRIQKDLASIDSYIFDNKELLELKRCDLAKRI
ncbi:conjugative transfer TraA domain protein [Rickettsia endosymbiont of Ixodes pacificus]|nr:conjugative transfer TraA domain protein [Rickettsia endosymbiont of Ixodes pacificus]